MVHSTTLTGPAPKASTQRKPVAPSRLYQRDIVLRLVHLHLCVVEMQIHGGFHFAGVRRARREIEIRGRTQQNWGPRAACSTT